MKELTIVGGWFLALVAGTAASGPDATAALQQPVVLPLWLILAVMMTPTSSFAKLSQSSVKAFESRFVKGA